MINIEIYQAKPEDGERLKQIAIASKSYWGYSEHLMGQWAQTPIITSELINKDIVYMACANSLIIGWYRLLIRLPVAILEDLWVLPDYIGKGVGRKLFEHAIQQADLSGAERLELDADPNAEPFYTRMGCKAAGESISEWGRAIPHMTYNLQR
ncbi:MAG: GNAT family N-acetyltransferase [Chloroflexi bacterium]|nr:GNAT family N-acetyltransferase [Chloroflexota bacterium]